MNALSRIITIAAAGFCVACGQSDETITASVKTKFAANTAINASQINVTTQNQVVTLKGNVDTPAVKDQALRLTRETSGVRDVVDNLEIRPAVASGAVETGVTNAAQATGDAVASGAQATGDAAQATGSAVGNAAKATGNAVVTGAKVAGEATVKGAETAADATAKGLEAAGSATVKGAEATASGAKKLGSGIAGAVTGGGGDKSAEKEQK